MSYPPVVVVDDHDNEIGSAMLAEVWQKGLYHRIVSVFVVDSQERMLLQLRSRDVAVFPNMWDQAAAGHVDVGHSYDQAAQVEVAEEIGLHDVTLTVLGTQRFNGKADWRIINQFERAYLLKVPFGVALQPDTHEVSMWQWFTKPDLIQQITDHPESLTPGFLMGLRKYFPEYTTQK
jgi:isopentenyl-diphosphate delta-isomerase